MKRLYEIPVGGTFLYPWPRTEATRPYVRGECEPAIIERTRDRRGNESPCAYYGGFYACTRDGVYKRLHGNCEVYETE